MKKIIPLSALATAVSSFVITTTTYAVLGGSEPVQNGADAARGYEMPDNLFGSSGTLSTFTNILLYVIGAIAVIMIVVGGLRYVISGGDSKQITAAKNTILYAVVGLVVALLAYAIINFVLGTFSGGGTAGTNV